MHKDGDTKRGGPSSPAPPPATDRYLLLSIISYCGSYRIESEKPAVTFSAELAIGACLTYLQRDFWLRQRLHVQWATDLWTFSSLSISFWWWGIQTGAAYSLGRIRGLYAAALVSLGAKAIFLRRKPIVLVALLVISLICWHHSRSSVIWTPKYLAEETFSKTWLCNV